MKKLITLVLVAMFAVPSVALSFDSFKTRTGKIGKDKEGGYSDTQRNYKKRRAAQSSETRKGGYHGGEYHNKSSEFKQGEWQFVKSADGKGKKVPKKKKK